MENGDIFWNILRLFVILYSQLVYYVVFWYIFLRFGMLYQDKSGKPAENFLPMQTNYNSHFCVSRVDLFAH
jgi:hypothetical protein